jgi:ABC-type branched-subunit amino acid transport system substrate-binding protein
MTRMVAAVAGMALLAAACSTSSTNSKAGKTTAPGGPTSAAPLTASATGVTPTAIRIGYSYPDLESLAKQGLIKTDNGPYADLMKAIVDDVNATGGINGRKLELTTEKFSVLDPNDWHRVCIKLTEDIKVFAVLGGFTSTDAAMCVVAQHKTLLVGGHGFGFSKADLAKAKAPWATWTPESERGVKAMVTLLDTSGALKGKKIGIYGQQTAAKPLVDIANQQLTAAGYHVEQTVINDVAASDAAAFNAQDKVLAQLLKDKGVDTVIVVGGTVPGTNFDAVGYHPSFYLPSSILITPSAYTNPLEKFPIVAGPAPSADPDAGFNTPAMQHCREVYQKATGIVIRTVSEDNAAGKSSGAAGMMFACSALQIFVEAAKRAGPNLTNETWAKGLEAIGKIAEPLAPIASFGPNKYDGQDSFVMVKHDPTWKPGSTKPEFIAIGQPIILTS